MIALNKLYDVDVEELVEMIAERVAEKLASRPVIETKALIDRHKLAKETGLSIATIDRRVKANEIPFHRSGRRILFELSEVVASIKQNANCSTAP